jgi:hypothetical protein
VGVIFLPGIALHVFPVVQPTLIIRRTKEVVTNRARMKHKIERGLKDLHFQQHLALNGFGRVCFL